MDYIYINALADKIQGFEDDMTKITAEINAGIVSAIRKVGEDEKESLRFAIKEGVYMPYSPKVYLRRSENKGYGNPLDDMDHNAHATFDMPVSGTIGGKMTFYYLPDGSNSATTADLSPENPFYDADDPKSINPQPKHGNDLIRRIETGSGYTTNFEMPRPFWQNFVNDMIEGGVFETSFINGMNAAGFQVKRDGVGVQRESKDGEY